MAEKKRNPFVWIVMILLFVGLLGFGTGNLGGNVRSLGTIGDKDLSIASYQGALNNQIRAVEAQTGQRLTLQQPWSDSRKNACCLDRRYLVEWVHAGMRLRSPARRRLP